MNHHVEKDDGFLARFEQQAKVGARAGQWKARRRVGYYLHAIVSSQAGRISHVAHLCGQAILHGVGAFREYGPEVGDAHGVLHGVEYTKLPVAVQVGAEGDIFEGVEWIEPRHTGAQIDAGRARAGRIEVLSPKHGEHRIAAVAYVYEGAGLIAIGVVDLDGPQILEYI